MKFTSIVFTTLLAVAFVEGTAIASPAPEAQFKFCYRPGEMCYRLKRAAEAAAEAVADEPTCHIFCYRPGENCGKSKRDELALAQNRAKRDALALAEATAEAFAAADPEANPCYASGAPCSIAKREALGPCNTHARRNYGGSSNGMCWQGGSSCGKLKRAAEAVAEAIAQPKQDSEDESGSWHGSCSSTEEACSKQKRALDDVNSLLDKILLRSIAPSGQL